MTYQITRVTNAAATASERGQNQLLVWVADVISVSGISRFVAAENRGRLGSPETADGQDRGRDDRSENGGLPECNHTRQSFNLDSAQSSREARFYGTGGNFRFSVWFRQSFSLDLGRRTFGRIFDSPTDTTG